MENNENAMQKIVILSVFQIYTLVLDSRAAISKYFHIATRNIVCYRLREKTGWVYLYPVHAMIKKKEGERERRLREETATNCLKQQN